MLVLAKQIPQPLTVAITLRQPAAAAWGVATTTPSNGSVNAMLDSFNPHTGLVLLAGMWLNVVFGFLAMVFATINVVGGFVVTDRMLAMFKRK